MTSSRVVSDLAQILVPIGVVGAVLAGLCAVVAAVAIVRGASGLTGGAVGVWIPFALVSSLAGFASQWIPLIAAGAALVGMLVIGAVVRGIVNAAGIDRPHPVREDAAAAAPAAAVATAAPVSTGAVPTLTRSNPVAAA
ncbi:hypothetical protein [Streptomyces sp. AC495_CC817]|uniref:hypothetical protein n=1 Tax=Streptomyces sp. AC495_CC817 TaxID=2823900 RepID=UPI001C256C61|nr:hypothetical protein [Streptomyces sp. AC495_CC817]